MTVQNAIERANDMRAGNSVSDETKTRWLSELDHNIYNDVIKTHHVTDKEFEAYTDGSNELIAVAPYDVLYTYWLMAQIDLANGEYNKYNAEITMFNTEWEDYAKHYNRTHMPMTQGKKRFLF